MDLERLLDGVEDAPDRIGLRVAGERFDVAFGEQVDVELRPDALYRVRQTQRGFVTAIRFAERIEDRPERRGVVPGTIGEPLREHDGGKGGVDRGGTERVLEGADEDGLVEELVLRPPQ